MDADTKEPWFLRVVEELNAFCAKVDEKVEKQEQQLKACKKNTELEIKMAQELKTNAELKEKLAKLSRQTTDLDRICSTFDSGLTITDRDQQRLDRAKEMYEIGKELTGVRFDFSAPPNLVKGYVKSSHRRVLQTFEMDQKLAVDGALWDIITNTAGKENFPP